VPLTVAVITGSARARSGATLMARIRGNNGLPLTQASVASIALTVTDTTTGIATFAGPLAVAASVFNSLQQSDPRWTRDSADYPGADGSWGYNFSCVVPAAALPNAVRYQTDVVITPVAGEPFRVVWSFVPVRVYA
jgi:hypothetical protein